MQKKRRKNRAYDYVVEGNLIIPLYLLSNEDFIRFTDAYSKGELEIITLH